MQILFIKENALECVVCKIMVLCFGLNVFEQTGLVNSIRWNQNQNMKLYFQENVFEYIVCKMLSILFRANDVNH